MVIQLRS